MLDGRKVGSGERVTRERSINCFEIDEWFLGPEEAADRECERKCSVSRDRRSRSKAAME